MPEAAPSALHLLRQAPFALFLGSRILSAAALQVQVVAVGWQVYALTDSALALGLVGLVQFLPMLVLTLAVGQVVDRTDRRLLVGLCRLLTGLAALGLAWGSLAGWLDSQAIFAFVALLGALRAFEMPAQQALLAGVVAARDLPRATALASSANQVATICGPALGGILYALGGAALPYLAAALAFLVAGGMALAIRTPPRVAMRGRVTLENLFSGLTFIWSRPVLLGAVSLDMAAVLLGGAAALLPIYARDILQTGPLGLGMLRAGPAVGALAMSLFLAWRPLGGRAGQKMFAAVIVFGVTVVVFGLSTSLVLSTLALAVMGAADVVSVVVRQSLVQLSTPDEMRGRVAAVNSLFIGTSNQLGEFESGAAAALIGPVPAVVLGGIGTIIVAVLWMRWFPALRDIDRLEDLTTSRA
ncbi:MFS transporter [Falsiroseomonas selenitidurans]|uniref:MFS transporter n=1 Tax=Falsiroseomonas selenitidurans TaxID=2716335 RepID=A0ABX1DYW8_9PROT|nr:MFS transporter [Falsiroseomonas selenitidurans]NKC30104.1 MFS transporter [Falsiroseomonas selenitidurans]